ncbi:putative membrane protein [Halanaeroarchaeum sp. HSR-CO]|uniref:hypothetical protein n=1 Tax=Halanaeroarchaeum sp. HSR-CO TaxID=2866382 RepID=UPI00217D260B|nr:hypothetical protein [Halanaeroarchaeum sp. HSR-CO]UWG46985.1 putative membrane protein [Halanaeroarchaeum sp. HSR-CO]
MSTATTLSASIRPTTLLAPLGVWLVLAVLAIANGIFREVLIIPRFGEYPGHVASTAMLVTVILVVSWLFFGWTGVGYTRAELIVIGLVWVVLTVGFEFLVGYVEGTPVSVTLGQYNVLAGQVWIVVPIALFVAPLLFGR